MAEIYTILNSMELDPADDASWQRFIAWLDERGDPVGVILSNALHRRNWLQGYHQVSRKLRFRELQILACDCVEPFLPLIEQLFPERDEFPRLVTALRKTGRGPWLKECKKRVALTGKTLLEDLDKPLKINMVYRFWRKRVLRPIPVVADPLPEYPTSSYWHEQASIRLMLESMIQIADNPRLACVNATYAADQLAEFLPPRSQGSMRREDEMLTKPPSEPTGARPPYYEIKFRRLVARTVGHYLSAYGYVGVIGDNPSCPRILE